ncbi:MAG: hypothetical protein QF681_05995 [Vicinamibacterales bacterium]|jgi:preprotein translocase subunit SecG|nr:hypothetical protein [Vicinamibacterales bacterium]
MLRQPATPLILELAEPATEQIGVGDVLVGALSFAGLMAIAAVVLAVLFAGVLIALRRVRRSDPLDPNDTNSMGLHLPSR